MSDTDGKKTLGLRGGPRSGQVKQSFSHGRTKNVVVETKRKRVVMPKAAAGASAGAAAVARLPAPGDSSSGRHGRTQRRGRASPARAAGSCSELAPPRQLGVVEKPAGPSAGMMRACVKMIRESIELTFTVHTSRLYIQVS